MERFGTKAAGVIFSAFLGFFGAGRRSIFKFLRLRAPFLNPTTKLKNMMSIDHKKTLQKILVICCTILTHFTFFRPNREIHKKKSHFGRIFYQISRFCRKNQKCVKMGQNITNIALVSFFMVIGHHIFQLCSRIRNRSSEP